MFDPRNLIPYSRVNETKSFAFSFQDELLLTHALVDASSASTASSHAQRLAARDRLIDRLWDFATRRQELHVLSAAASFTLLARGKRAELRELRCSSLCDLM